MQPSDLLLFWHQYRDSGTYREETITLLCSRMECIAVSSGVLRESRRIIPIFRYLEVNKVSTTAKNINAPCSSEIVCINSLLALLTLHRAFNISIIHSQIRTSVCSTGYQVYHLLHLPKCYCWKGWDLRHKPVLGLGPTPAASTHTKRPQYGQHSHRRNLWGNNASLVHGVALNFMRGVHQSKGKSFKLQQITCMPEKYRLGKSHASHIPGRVVSPLSAAGRASTGSTRHVQKRNKKANKNKQNPPKL